MKTIKPSSLNKGDTIGVFAPSSWVEKADIERGAKILEDKGFKVFVHPQTYEREHQSAGNHLQKTLAFQGLWQRKDIKAIWAAGGGNRATHLIDSINFKNLQKNPKLLIGFSDVTALLNAVTAKTGIATLHGPVLKNIHKHKELDSLIKLISGDLIDLKFSDAQIIKSAEEKSVSGKLIGGNLSVFQYLPQGFEDQYCEGSILFLEDCNEELSRIDRMLLHLKRIGVFKKLKAVMLGEFVDIPETGKPFGYTLTDLIKEHTSEYDITVLKDLPLGHGKNLMPLPIGTSATIDTKQKVFKLDEPCTNA